MMTVTSTKPLGQSPTSNLVAPPHLIIAHLHLVNLTNVRLGRLTDLENIQNIAIFKSVIVGDVNILSANTNMFLENY